MLLGQIIGFLLLLPAQLFVSFSLVSGTLELASVHGLLVVIVLKQIQVPTPHHHFDTYLPIVGSSSLRRRIVLLQWSVMLPPPMVLRGHVRVVHIHCNVDLGVEVVLVLNKVVLLVGWSRA